MTNPEQLKLFNDDKPQKKLPTLKKVKSVTSTLLLIVVMLMSGINMWTAPTAWMDTMWTCIWCLSLVSLTDRVDNMIHTMMGSSGE